MYQNNTVRMSKIINMNIKHPVFGLFHCKKAGILYFLRFFVFLSCNLLILRRSESGYLLKRIYKRCARLKAYTFGYGLGGETSIFLAVRKTSAGFFYTVFVQQRIKVTSILFIYNLRHISVVCIGEFGQAL